MMAIWGPAYSRARKSPAPYHQLLIEWCQGVRVFLALEEKIGSPHQLGDFCEQPNEDQPTVC
jgi:hypothetical protein